ncbi:MAG TPA: glutathione S-transferase family protein [Gaiellaceae bacterium]|nr:glutathione S-transferase family protein [Gaiellaceae bacterium]
MLRLFDYPASANCYKVRLLLHQLELPYERVEVDIFAGDTLADGFAAMNVARRTPVLELAPGDFLPESNAILLHLAEATGFLPADRRLRAHVYQWLFFEQNFFEPSVGGLRFRTLTGRDGVDGLRPAAETAMTMLDAHLAGREFLVGSEYTVADTSLYAYAHVAHEGGLELERRPAVRVWLDRVERTPRWLDDLRPYPQNARAGQGASVHG